jgi:hypothetical protein
MTGKDATAQGPSAEVRGLACPKCGCRHLLVVYTRPRAEHFLRVPSSRHCARRAVTRERRN